MKLLLRFPQDDVIWNYSNPRTVQRRAKQILGKNVIIYRSNLKNKKYKIITPDGKTIHFGYIPMEDFTKHKDELRRQNYLKRSAGIKGNWQNNPYSANNLSRSLLWNA